jgi:hypothetical protein
MKPLLTAVGLAVFIGVITPSAHGEGFNDEQFQALNGLLGSNAASLQEDADKRLDLVLQALGEAYQGSSYHDNKAAESVRTKITQEAAALKTAIAALQKEVAANHDRANNPAVMLLLLSKEQSINFKIYRWIRTAVEFNDLAHASSGSHDDLTGEFLGKMINNHETVDDVLGSSMQAIAMLLSK